MTNDDKRKAFDLVVWTSSVLFACALVAHEALAKDKSFAVTDPVYQGECGSCHVAYPPALLPPGSWKVVMSGLDKHFGTDASVDAKSLAALRAWREIAATAEVAHSMPAFGMGVRFLDLSEEDRKVIEEVVKSR